MIAAWIRHARIANLKLQAWILGRALAVCDVLEDQMSQPPTPRRRRKKAKPEAAPEIPASMTHEGVHVGAEALAFFTEDALMEKRRRHLGQLELTHLVSSALLQHGMPADLLTRTRWLWSRNPQNGSTELYLILPGVEA